MHPPADGLGTQLACDEGALIVGDLGLIVLRAMLENGVGYVVTGALEAANPIDAAIADARGSVLERNGVLLRRLRSFDQLADTIAEPGRSAAAHDGPMRGLVVWDGRSGLRPALQRFCDVEVRGPVVGLCFDEDAARVEGLALIDPEPTPEGVVAAIDRAFAISAATSRPALVLIRERSLGMRGVIRCRRNLRPVEVQALDAEIAPVDLADAASVHGVDESWGEPGELLLAAAAPVARAVLAARERLGRLLGDAGAVDASRMVAQAQLISVGMPGSPGARAREAVAAARFAIVVEDRSTRLSSALGDGPRVARAGVDAASTDVTSVALELVSTLAGMGLPGLEPAACNEVAAALGHARSRVDEHVADRLPRRGATRSRNLPEPIAAGLVLAQAAIGVPVRLHAGHPSYRTDGGSALTIVSDAQLAEHGMAIAAPEALGGTFVVHGGMSTATREAVAAAGASMEVVDGSRPRQLAEAIARACRQAAGAPHVIFVGQPTAATIDDRIVGVDSELLGIERISACTMPEPAVTVREDHENPLSPGPVLVVRDGRIAQAGLAGARELSPAWHDVRVGAARTGLLVLGRTVRRHLVRMIGGMEQ